MGFPKLIPSNRRFQSGNFPVTRHKMMSNAKQSMLFATSAFNAQLRLTYENRTPSEIAEFIAHYDELKGTHGSFAFEEGWKDEVWGGWTKRNIDVQLLAINGRWRYAAPPRISQPKFGVATIEIALKQVPGTKTVDIPAAIGGGKPSPRPETPRILPPNFPPDAPPDAWPPPGVPPDAPVPASIPQPDNMDWNPNNQRYWIGFRWKWWSYRKGTKVCRNPGFGPCDNGTPQGERYDVGPEWYWTEEEWQGLPHVAADSTWTLEPWDKNANFGYWYKPPGSGYDDSVIPQAGKCCSWIDDTTPEYTCGDTWDDGFCGDTFLTRRSHVRLLSNKTLSSGRRYWQERLLSGSQSTLQDDEGLWTHGTVITQVLLRPIDQDEWWTYIDNRDIWNGVTTTRSVELTAASAEEDCPGSGAGSPLTPGTPILPPPSDPGDGGSSGGAGTGSGGSGGPNGPTPAPSPGPGQPKPPTDVPPYGFIPDGNGGFIPNPEQTGAYVRVYDWVNSCEAAYARNQGPAQCTKREGPIGPAETWKGFSALGVYTIATTYKEEDQDLKELEVSPNSFWEWPDGDRTGQSRIQANGQSITWTCYAVMEMQPYQEWRSNWPM